MWEKDEIRKDDSFAAFEEVFEIAAANNADLVLLGGDLFHDNKPSRYTIVRWAGAVWEGWEGWLGLGREGRGWGAGGGCHASGGSRECRLQHQQ